MRALLRSHPTVNIGRDKLNYPIARVELSQRKRGNMKALAASCLAASAAAQATVQVSNVVINPSVNKKFMGGLRERQATADTER